MVKHTQTIRRKLPTNCLSVFDHFVGLALKGLRKDTKLSKVRLSMGDVKWSSFFSKVVELSLFFPCFIYLCIYLHFI